MTLLLSSCARTEESDSAVVDALAVQAGRAPGSILLEETPASGAALATKAPRQVVQGAVTGINRDGTLLSLLVELVWWPEVRAGRQRMDLSIDGATRFVPETSNATNLSIGDEVQVRVSYRGPALGRATEITVLDLD